MENVKYIPKVSVVIPTYNRDKCLFNALNSILGQEYTSIEIIVIDQSSESSDSKQKYFEEHKNIVRIFDQHPNRCRAKNLGIKKSTGDIILICDDDIIAPVNLVSRHVAQYDNKYIGAVSTRVFEEGQNDNLYTGKTLRLSFYGRIYNNSHSRESSFVQFLNGGNMSFRRSVLEEVGFFEERYIGTGMMEEPDIGYRISKKGYKIFFDGETTVLHFPQFNGNKNNLVKDRIVWYHDFFYNFTLYHLKYRLFLKLIISFPWICVLTLRQFFIYRLKVSDGYFMIKGFFYKR
jgi:GT2 family glycosyltransferase